MSVLPIRLYGDPALRQTCAPAEVDDGLRRLAADMIETMYDAPGRGLAAPQVGVALRLFVMDCGWKDGAPRAPMVAVNPVLSDPSAERKVAVEGCLSLPGVAAAVERPAAIRMAWTDLEGARHERVFEGFEAICVQHETDHLDGVLNIDHLSEEARAALAPALAALEGS